MLFTLLICNSFTISTLSGPLSNGYQQSPANFSLSSGGNMSSMGAQTITSQMIPTPGFNSNSSSNSNNNNNQSYMNLESANNGGGFSTVESAVVSQPPQQKQHLGGQNSRILHNLGSQMGSGGIRSVLQPKAYAFPNGAINGGLGLIGNNLQLLNESGTSEGFLTGASYANSPKPLQQHIDQHQRPLMQGNLSLSLYLSLLL
jgi:E1A/CREB-binding protein